MSVVTGLHHVTAIAGDPQENLDFYAGRLGMRLVKRSVNQDVPGTYHLFYADGAGHPGSDLTFFPWPDMPPGRQGVGHTVEVGLAVPPGSLGLVGAAPARGRASRCSRSRPASASGRCRCATRTGCRLPWWRPPTPGSSPPGTAARCRRTGRSADSTVCGCWSASSRRRPPS